VVATASFDVEYRYSALPTVAEVVRYKMNALPSVRPMRPRTPAVAVPGLRTELPPPHVASVHVPVTPLLAGRDVNLYRPPPTAVVSLPA